MYKKLPTGVRRHTSRIYWRLFRPSPSSDEVLWAYRLFLGREPESRAIINAQMAAHESVDGIRRDFIRSTEFEAYYRSLVPAPRYGIAPFLLPSASDNGKIAIETPTMAHPASQMCTHSQFLESDYKRVAKALSIDDEVLHRKNWEWCYIIRVLESAGMIASGKRGVGFGCGTEPLPSLMAARGVQVLVSDAPQEVADKHGWSSTQQYASSLHDVWKPRLVDKRAFDDLVSSQVVDMRSIASNIRDFDFTWSSCALEHLGSLQAGLDFIVSSMDCLKPGGIAVHTTEFNISSNDETVETEWLSVYRKKDIEQLVEQLYADGHSVWPLNFFPGREPIDEHIDTPPFTPIHLKLQFMGATFTSIGLVIQKAA